MISLLRDARASLMPTLLLALACGADDAPGPLPPAGPCGAVVEQAPTAEGIHNPQGTALTWATNPPAEGPHYPVWAPWAQAFTEPVPRGNWLHNAEHGGVVLLYRCADGCPALAGQLKALGAALPRDASCQGAINARWLLTPDPLLPDGVQVAAVAWGFAYRASCLDAASLQAFISARYNRAPEDLCGDGAIAWR